MSELQRQDTSGLMFQKIQQELATLQRSVNFMNPYGPFLVATGTIASPGEEKTVAVPHGAPVTPTLVLGSMIDGEAGFFSAEIGWRWTVDQTNVTIVFNATGTHSNVKGIFHFIALAI